MAYNDSYNKPGPGFGLSIGSRWTRSIMILIIVNVSVFVVQLLFSTISSQWGGVSPGTDIDGIITAVSSGARSIYHYFLALSTSRYRKVVVMAVCNVHVSS